MGSQFGGYNVNTGKGGPFDYGGGYGGGNGGSVVGGYYGGNSGYSLGGNQPTASGTYQYQYNSAGDPRATVRSPSYTGDPGSMGYSMTQAAQNSGAMPTGGGSGTTVSTTGGGFAANQDLWNQWKSSLMGALAHPGLSEQTIQDMTNKSQEDITGREQEASRSLNDKVAAMGGAQSGGSAEANRQLMSDYAGQGANAKRDIRTSAAQDAENRLQQSMSTGGSFLSHLQDLDAENQRFNASQNAANQRTSMMAGAVGGSRSPMDAWGAFNLGTGGGANYSDVYGDANPQQGYMTGGSGLIGDQYGGGLGNPDYSGVNTPSGFTGGNTQGTWFDNPFAPVQSQAVGSNSAALDPFNMQGMDIFSNNPYGGRQALRVA